jgi:hypothetical protein
VRAARTQVEQQIGGYLAQRGRARRPRRLSPAVVVAAARQNETQCRETLLEVTIHQRALAADRSWPHTEQAREQLVALRPVIPIAGLLRELFQLGCGARAGKGETANLP